MKRMILMLLAGVMVFTIQLSHPKEAEANPRCRRLAKKVRTYTAIRSRYLKAWRRCKWNQGKYSPRCLRLRNKVKGWYANVRSARTNYNTWGCRFGWNKWRDPWAVRQARRRAAKKAARKAIIRSKIRSRIRYKTAKCQSLSSKVTIYKSIRNSYYRSYSKFRCSGWFRRWTRRCRRLKEKVIKYRAKVRAARNHYRAWRCGFAWKRWKKRWHW